VINQAREVKILKYQEILSEVSEFKKIKLIFTNFNDRSEDKEFKLTQIKLDKLIDIHDLLNFVGRRIGKESIMMAMQAVSGAITSGQPIQEEDYLDMHFAVDVKFGDSARGISILIKEDGTVTFKIRVDQLDQPGIISFDDNFLEFKALIKTSLSK